MTTLFFFSTLHILFFLFRETLLPSHVSIHHLLPNQKKKKKLILSFVFIYLFLLSTFLPNAIFFLGLDYVCSTNRFCPFSPLDSCLPYDITTVKGTKENLEKSPNAIPPSIYLILWLRWKRIFKKNKGFERANKKEKRVIMIDWMFCRRWCTRNLIQHPGRVVWVEYYIEDLSWKVQDSMRVEKRIRNLHVL